MILRIGGRMTLYKMYFIGSRLRCVENHLKMKRGSPIFKLLNVAIPIVNSNLKWSLGNGKIVRIWDDGINGMNALCNKEDLSPLKIWMEGMNLHTLCDISYWDNL